MWCKPTEKQLAKIPAFYSGKNTSIEEKKIYMHFFMGGCDWYATEYNPEEGNFFGFAILNGMYDMAEWGYFNYRELCELKMSFLEVDRDKFWKVRKAKEVEKICKAQRWSYAKV